MFYLSSVFVSSVTEYTWILFASVRRVKDLYKSHLGKKEDVVCFNKGSGRQRSNRFLYYKFESFSNDYTDINSPFLCRLDFETYFKEDPSYHV